MKKNFILLVLLFVVLIPTNAYAFDLVCDNSSHKIGDVFTCKITGYIVQYDKLSGTIASDESLSCKKDRVSPGLNALSGTTGNYFDLSGTPSTEDFITISCEVLINSEETTNASVYVEDFKYHIVDSGMDEASIILKSDYIKIEHKEDEVAQPTKPRDISDPSVRPRRLISKELNITFSQFITEYTVEVLYDTEEVSFDYELNDPTSNLRIEGSTKLQVGENVIDVYITSADSSKEACYTFYVKRLARGEEIYYPESDSTLKSMTIPGYSIGFEQNVFEYKVHLPNNVNSLNINTIPNYEKATVSISDTDNLNNGNVIAVEVTSADETSKTTYKIFITKDAPKKDYSKIIFAVLLGVGLIVTIILFIITTNKKKNDPLLSIKTKKRKINKGKSFDASIVPESNNTPIINEENLTNTIENSEVNTINLSNENTVEPIQTDKVELDSFNQANSVNESIDLTTNVTPIPVADNSVHPVENPVQPVEVAQEQATNQVLQGQTNINAPIPEQQINTVAPEQNIVNNNPENNQNTIQ